MRAGLTLSTAHHGINITCQYSLLYNAPRGTVQFTYTEIDDDFLWTTWNNSDFNTGKASVKSTAKHVVSVETQNFVLCVFVYSLNACHVISCHVICSTNMETDLVSSINSYLQRCGRANKLIADTYAKIFLRYTNKCWQLTAIYYTECRFIRYLTWKHAS